MAWVEAHQSLQGHPKTRKAALRLGISKPQLIGHLFCLWWWALDYAPDGDVSRFDADDLALAAEWCGESEAFVAALIDCRYGDGIGFLERRDDGRLVIHDWWDYAGKWITKRKADAERKVAERSAARASAEKAPAHPPDVHDDASINSAPVQRTSNGHPTDGSVDGARNKQPTYLPTNNQPTNQPTNQDVAPDADAPSAHRALWDGFTVVFGEARGKTERQRRGEACKRAAEASATPDEVLTAAQHWPNVMGDATMTELGIVANLGKLLHGPQVNGRSAGTVRQHTQRLTETALLTQGDSVADLRRQGRLTRAS